MTATDERRTAAAQWVALLTLAWVLAVPVLVVTGTIESWNPAQVPDHHTGSWLLLAAAVVAVLLPLLATVLAYRGNRPVLGAVYALLTLCLLVPAGFTVMETSRELSGYQPAPPEPPPGPPGICMDHSGGQGECPGG